MSTLKTIQNSFCEAVLGRESNLDFIRSNFANERLNIYRQTILENLRNSLSITFPGTWKLLGTECSDSVAYAFLMQTNNFPSTGCLDYWGDKFPDFLGRLPELKHLPYIQDYATYEWIKHLSYSAENVTSISNEDLQAIDPDLIESVCFSFIPSLFTFESNFSINDIDEIATNPEATAINLGLDQSYMVIARPQNQILTYWTNHDLWIFIHAIEQGLNLTEANDMAQEQYPDFDLTAAIHFLLSHKLIYKITIKEDYHEKQ